MINPLEPVRLLRVYIGRRIEDLGHHPGNHSQLGGTVWVKGQQRRFEKRHVRQTGRELQKTREKKVFRNKEESVVSHMIEKC